MLSDNVAIRIRGLTRVFGDSQSSSQVFANDGVSLDVPRGEIFGLLGANGAGKTTLVLQIMGLLRPDSGTIHVDGVDVVRYPDEAKQVIGFLPQSSAARGQLEIERALHYTGRLRGQSDRDARDQTRALLDELGLTGLRSRSIGNLSGGEARLVSFGMALMGRPRVIILDEPTNELDPAVRRVVWNKIKRLNEIERVTCVLVTHNLLEAEKVVQRVAVMSHGKVIACGTPGELAGSASAGGQEQALTLEDAYLKLHDRDAAARPARSDHALEATFAEVTPPRPSLGLQVKRFAIALKYLWFEQMLDIRAVWQFTAIIGMVMPLAMVFGITRIGTGLKDPTSLLYIITGVAVFSLTTEGIVTLAQRISQMRVQGMLQYYATLPISKVAFFLAVASAKMLIALPGMIIPITAGAFMYDLQVSVSPWLLLIFPLASLCVSTVGLGIGMLVKRHEFVVAISNILLFVLLLASPLMIPISSLPVPLQILGRAMPPTYAAEALRLALGGDVATSVFRDIAILAVLTAASFAVLSRIPLWRRA